MDIPSQPGLLFNVSINLQQDELYLDVGARWLEWFPCTDADVVAKFREAVRGVLSGTFRIVERLARRSCGEGRVAEAYRAWVGGGWDVRQAPPSAQT